MVGFRRAAVCGHTFAGGAPCRRRGERPGWRCAGCLDRLAADPEPRLFDVPWLVMDSTAARQRFGWRPLKSIESILEEIAGHVRDNPEWLEQCGVL